MTSKNAITGDKIQSKVPSKEYKEGWERIYGKKREFIPVEEAQKIVELEMELAEHIDPAFTRDREEGETLLEYYDRKTLEIDRKYRNED